jgi:protein-arginine kinase activator protein McsA
MHEAADNLDFETAAILRDEIRELEKKAATAKAVRQRSHAKN